MLASLLGASRSDLSLAYASLCYAKPLRFWPGEDVITRLLQHPTSIPNHALTPNLHFHADHA